MKLSTAAAAFDDLVCVDGYAGTGSFKAQMDLYDDSKRDGYSVVRRILATTPSVSMPARKVVDVKGDKWIVGQVAKDYFRDTAIRHKHLIHKANGLAESYTIAGILATTPAATSTFYAAEAWIKGAREIDESSDVTDVLTMYFSTSESVLTRTIFKLGGNLHLVRNVHGTSSGFNAADVDILDAPNLETVSFATKIYNPVTATYTTTTTSAKVLRIRWQSKFNYFSLSSQTYETGDDVVMVLKTALTPKTGDTIPLSDGVRVVRAVTSDGDCWHLHVRRA
jgi:hypothetical protein